MARPRLRDLGISLGLMPPGALNAITDVPGVEVGHVTIVSDTPNLVRTGVTAILPRPAKEALRHSVYAGVHSFNGYGEMTGTPWIEESGILDSAICLTNTQAVGVVRDAVFAFALKHDEPQAFHLPVVAETWDGWLSDANSFPVRAEHALQALAAARGGPVEEGNVGGGTGMIAHEFKGGIGTASRCLEFGARRYAVGALVQANYGSRRLFRVDGVPVGEAISPSEVPAPWPSPRDAGSIIVVLATDAPLIPAQCRRLARRATVGLAWVGGYGANGSGDIFLAFSTANRIPTGRTSDFTPIAIETLPSDAMTPLFLAAAEATQEAILNAMVAAETTIGFQGRTAHALPHDRLQAVVRRYRSL